MNCIIVILISLAMMIGTYCTLTVVEDNIILDDCYKVKHSIETKEYTPNYLDDGKIFIIDGVVYMQYNNCLYYCKKL